MTAKENDLSHVKCQALTPQGLLASANSINDQYEIMSFAAQAQCPALGSVSADVLGHSDPQDNGSTDLQTLWVNDPYLNNFTDHVWHSAEFEFSYALQQKYWQAVMLEFNLSNQ